MMDPAVVAAKNVTVCLGNNKVLQGIDLTVTNGEFVALLGANGSGKTTLVRALLGVARLDSGTVQLFGQ